MPIDYPRALLAALALTVGVAVVVAASTSGAAFGLYNPAWDGASDLRGLAADAGTDPTVVRNASAYGQVPAAGTVAVVLAPEARYGPAEADGVRAFVEGGGTLVVADDVDGPANALLADVGAEARLDGRRLRDEQHYYRAPALPVAADVADHAYTRDVDALTLNHATAVVPAGATPIVRTSGVAYLDSDGNGALDDGEPVGPFPVATVEPVGEGRVVVVSDPSAFVNAMLERPGNRAFATAVVAAHDRVLLDYSHAGPLPPLSAALLSIRGSPPLQVLVGAIAVGAVGLWARWPSIRRSPLVRSLLGRLPGRTTPSSAVEPPDADALAADLRRRRPDWAPERVGRVVERAVRSERAAEEPTEGDDVS